MVQVVLMVLAALWLSMGSLLLGSPHHLGSSSSSRDHGGGGGGAISWAAAAFTGPSVATLRNNSGPAFTVDSGQAEGGEGCVLCAYPVLGAGCVA